MKSVKLVVAIALSCVAFAIPSSSCIAQQVTGELGSPNATTTIDLACTPKTAPK
jgi:hypothetical protein